MTTGLDVRAGLASRRLDLAFTVQPGETVALLGPNGAGKSTVLGVIAGLIRADSGHVQISGRTADRLPPHRRGVALLSQDPLLFPHLTVLENVAFGPRSLGAGRREARSAAREHLERVGMGEFLQRRPRELSGGQAQRAAIARALAARPDVVLLDEPFAAVDAESRAGLRHELRDVLAGRTAVIVTHDVLDALTLASRVIVLEGGRIIEEGTTTEVLTRPRTAFAAGLAGFNIVPGRWTGAAAATPLGDLQGVPEESLDAGDDVVVLVRPGAIAIFPSAPEGSMRNRVTGPITRIDPLGDRLRVRIERAGVPLAAEITLGAAAELGLDVGDTVTLATKATEVIVLRRPDTP